MNNKQYYEQMRKYREKTIEYIKDIKSFYAKTKFDIEKVKDTPTEEIPKVLDEYFVKPLYAGAGVNVSIIKTLLFLLYQIVFSNTPQYEVLYVLGFTKNFYLRDIDIAYVGTKVIRIDIESFLIKLKNKDVKKFIIAHNHEVKPSPSDLDLNFTEELAKYAEMFNLEFIDHIILTPNEVYSFRENFYDFKRILNIG